MKLIYSARLFETLATASYLLVHAFNSIFLVFPSVYYGGDICLYMRFCSDLIYSSSCKNKSSPNGLFVCLFLCLYSIKWSSGYEFAIFFPCLNTKLSKKKPSGFHLLLDHSTPVKGV